MLRNIFIIFLISTITIACKENKSTTIKDELDPIQSNSKSNGLVFENNLTQENIQGADYNNVVLSDQGAKFSSDELSFIRIPANNIDLNSEFNISFWFKFDGDFGPKPPALFVLKNQYSSPSNAPLYIFLPARKVSAVFGKQKLFATNYDPDQGYSREYYDSFQLSPGVFYFLSVSYSNSKLQIFVNSELYAEYQNLISPETKGEEIYLGAFPFDNQYKSPLDGNLKGLKIHSKALSQKELVELYNSEPSL